MKDRRRTQGRVQQIAGLQESEALREERDWAQKYLDIAGVMLVALNREGEIVLLNRKGHAILGYEDGELLGRNWFDTCVSAGIREGVRDVFDSLMAGEIEAVDKYENPVLTQSGEERIISWSNTVLNDEAGQIVGTLSSGEDVTERKHAQETLQRRAAQLALLNDIGGRITVELELDTLLSTTARLLQESFGYHHVALFVLDGKELVMRARAGDFVDLFPADHRTALGSGMVGWAALYGVTLLANDVSTEPRYINHFPEVIPTRSELSVPIRVGGERWGVLDLQSPRLNAFDEDDVLVLETLAGQIASAIENARLYESVQQELAERRRAEEALRQSEATLRSVFRAAPVGIGLVRDRVLIWTNATLHRMVGYSAEELEGQSSRILYDSDDEFEWVGREKYARLREQGTGTVETRIRRKDGQIIDILLSSTALDPSDMSAGVVFTALDITARRQAEEELRHRTEQLEALRHVEQELSRELNLEALLHSIVSQAVELLGTTAGGLYLYRPDRDVVELVVAVGLEASVVGTSLQPGEGLAGKIWTTGKPLAVDVYNDLQAKSIAYGEDEFSAVVGVPIHWGEGFLGVLEVLADAPRVFSSSDMELLSLFATQAAIALRNARLFEAEQERRREAEALRHASLVLGSTLDPEQILDQLLQEIGRVIPYDSASILWLEEGVGRIVHQRGRIRAGTQEATAAFRQTVEEFPNLYHMYRTRQPHIVSDTRSNQEWILLKETAWIRSWAGAPIVVRDEVVAFFSLDSETPGFYTAEHADLLAAFAAHAAVAIENASLFAEMQAAYQELTRTQAQLVQSAKMAAIGELAAGVAHELNNPLTSVLGFSGLALRDTDADDPLHDDLLIVVEEARRARDIVRGLLDFSRQSEASFEITDINRVVNDSVSLIRPQFEKRGVALDADYASDLPALPLSVGQMMQVFLNLIDNALYAMPEGGSLRISTELVGDQVAVRFADTGEGIPEDHRKRIFEPFYTTKPQGQGTGLGLSVSLGIVQEHGGHIQVESQPGRGSTFTIWLPVEATVREGDNGR